MEFKDGQIVHRISGPITYQYLTPPADHPERPIVLLFGDRHHSEEEMCASCTCDEKDCCQAIYDVSFLQKIDRIAEQYPVDFYTESSFSTAQKASNAKRQDVLFKRLLHDTARGCHNASARSSSSYDCPTHAIRWHHADVRTMKHKVEGYLTYMVEYAEAFRPDRIPYLDIVMAPRARNQSVALRDEAVAYLREYLVILRGVESNEDKIRAIIDHLFVFLKRESDPRISLLFKQHAKLRDPAMQSLDVWKTYMFEQMMRNKDIQINLTNLLNYLKTGAIDPTITRLFDLYLSAIQFKGSFMQAVRGIPYPADLQEYSDIMGEMNDMIYQVTLLFHSHLLDMYMMMRMFGRPKDNDVPVLAIGFYGALHSNNIAEGLQRAPFGYTLVHSSDSFSPMRCMDLRNTPIPLDRDVTELAQRRYAAQPELLQQYQQRLLTEQMGRMSVSQAAQKGGRKGTSRTSRASKQTSKRKGTSRRKRTSKRKN